MKTLRYYKGWKEDGIYYKVEVTHDEALHVLLGTWKDNDMTRDMLMIANRIECMYSTIDVEEETENGTLVLMAGLYNQVNTDYEYDENGNRKEAQE